MKPAFDVRELAVPGIRGLQPYQPGKPLEELEREYGIRNAIKLASNENPLGPSPLALAAVQNALGDLARYPDGSGILLKNALAQKLGVLPAQITLGNGSNDILELAARIFVAPGEKVLFSEYGFAIYPIATQAVGGTAVIVPVRDWGHDLAAMRRALSPDLKLIFLANPNNPTGTWFNEQVLEEFLAAVPAQTIVLLDEAYFEYVTEPGYPDGLTLLPKYPNLVVTRTFSKIYGLAGLRVGYGISSPEIADLFNRTRQPFNVNSLAQLAAIAALQDTAHFYRSREVNSDGMRQLMEGCARLGLVFIPSAANFISVGLDRPGAQVYEALLREGVIVRPLASYSMPRHVRVTIGVPEENRRFLAALGKILK